jgi:signal transduction histidine kinase
MIAREANLPILRSCKLFAMHGEKELVEMGRLLEEEQYEAGRKVFSLGDIGDCLYVVASGAVNLTQTVVAEKDITRDLGTLRTGAFFGEMALIDQTARSADATAVENTVLLSLSRPVLNGELEKGNSAVSKILKETSRTLSLRVRTLEDIMGDLISGVYMLNKDGKIFPREMPVTEMLQHNRRIFMEIIRDIAHRDEVNRMKNEFVAMASHELRTPLTSIRGSLGLLSAGVAGELPQEAMELLAIAGNNTERLLRLVSDILDIEKIESGKTELDIKEVSMPEIVRKSVDEMGGFAAERGVALESEIQPGNLMVDFDRIVQVLDNLISNAVKFSPEGGKVLVRARMEKGFATLSVTDFGPGIPEDFKARIFHKFQQADKTVAREKGGTGLGLAVCKTIVDGHGGKIWFESQEGHGATFVFTLPAAGKI